MIERAQNVANIAPIEFKPAEMPRAEIRAVTVFAPRAIVAETDAVGEIGVSEMRLRPTRSTAVFRFLERG